MDDAGPLEWWELYTEDDDEETEGLMAYHTAPLSTLDVFSALSDMRNGEGNYGPISAMRRVLSDVAYHSNPANHGIEAANGDIHDNIIDTRLHSKSFESNAKPQKAGIELLSSGDFGRVANRQRLLRNEVNIARLHIRRLQCPLPMSYKEDYTHNLVPDSIGTAVAAYGTNIYTGQYSPDSSFFYTCSQDFYVHVFDTTAPPTPPDQIHEVQEDLNLQTTMKITKSIRGLPGNWTITDANLSPDQQLIAYSSLTPTVYIASIQDASTTQIPIQFSDAPAGNIRRREDRFGIWSCRFSADGNELVAGGSGKIFVYDLLANKKSVKISAHEDDVNSCCWADISGNILASASDDTFIKVWDRRSLGTSQEPSGVLIGHTKGITYVSAKGDGRYVISNGKDQALRLWDLRKMRSSQEYESVKCDRHGVDTFDYRYMSPRYLKSIYPAHPMDCSVMTYRGHCVLRTLIRCHFSPEETTGSQYLYSGSADGKIHVWSLDGTVVQVLDRSKRPPMPFDFIYPEPDYVQGHHPMVCVRDVSWHSQEPVLMSSAWDSGQMGSSILARHEWKGLAKVGGRLEDWVEKHRQEGFSL